MNRLEAYGVLLCFALIGVLAAWLILSRVWGKHRVPERWTPDEPVSLAELSAAQNQINRIREKSRRLHNEVIGPAFLHANAVAGFDLFGGASHVMFSDGRRLRSTDQYLTGVPLLTSQTRLTALGREVLVTRGIADPDEWLRENSIGRLEARSRMVGVLDGPPPDFAGAIDDVRRRLSPSQPLFDHSPPRPWAHG